MTQEHPPASRTDDKVLDGGQFLRLEQARPLVPTKPQSTGSRPTARPTKRSRSVFAFAGPSQQQNATQRRQGQAHTEHAAAQRSLIIAGVRRTHTLKSRQPQPILQIQSRLHCPSTETHTHTHANTLAHSDARTHNRAPSVIDAMVRHANNDSHAQKPPKAKGEVLHVTLEAAAYEELGIMPWFSYHVKLPVKPLPPVADRPHTKTQRLTVRPITGDDLEQFHRLRSFPEVQNHCKLNPSNT